MDIKCISGDQYEESYETTDEEVDYETIIRNELGDEFYKMLGYETINITQSISICRIDKSSFIVSFIIFNIFQHI